MSAPDPQVIVVFILLTWAVAYIARNFYKQFVLGKTDCHCGNDTCSKKSG